DSKEEDNNKTQETQLSVHADDQTRVSNEMDDVTNDLNVPLEQNSSFSGKIEGDTICGASISYDTLSSVRKITITYKGTDCGGFRSRTGSVVLSMPVGMRWKDVGAEITVTYQNLKITRSSDSKSITINGSHILKNVNGGLLRDLLTGRPNITHTISSSNMSITFDDGSQRQWQVARKRVYTLAGGGTITITGNHEEGGVNGSAEWGTDRFGQTFITSITQPLVISGSCQFRLVSGEVKHSRAATSATVTFGLDKDGKPVSCPSGTYYFKLSWTGPAGNTYTYIAPY
ncbi:MAG TPA: hypothetical protein VHK91_10110, partial [Flavisolibacter sp.]|nr:hypothetical protein [Flavisolibacter sp.]